MGWLTDIPALVALPLFAIVPAAVAVAVHAWYRRIVPPERLDDGQEALDFLRGEGAYAGRNSNQPVLLLLDIKMPRVDGMEVLRQLKSEPRTALIPVIMLTTTDDPREIQRCYELGCSVYITKPVEYQRFVEAIKRLGLFLQVVRVPENGQRTS